MSVHPRDSVYSYYGTKSPRALHTISNNFYRYRDSAIDRLICSSDSDISNSWLPEGWYETTDQSGITWYSHPSLKDGPPFSYPLYALNTTPEGPYDDRDIFLRFDTTAATMHLSDTSGLDTNQTACDTNVRTFDGQWAGVLRHNLTQREMQDEINNRATCKLITLSKGRIKQNVVATPFGFVEWDHPERQKKSENGLYEFYNVLWIEEVGDACYRKALGRIQRQVWDKWCSDVHVKLG